MVTTRTKHDTREKPPQMVVFSTSTPDRSTVISWENGPQKQTGIAKRGRPKKGGAFKCHTLTMLMRYYRTQQAARY